MALLISRVQFVTVAIATCVVLYWFFNSSSIPSVHWTSTQCELDKSLKITTSATVNEPIVPYSYINMNNDKSQVDVNGTHTAHVLILTPFKQSVQFIDRFFDNVNKLTYPHHLISLGFLVSDSTDGTIEKLKERAEFESRAESWKKFNSIAIFQKDFKFDLASSEERHAFEVQVKRRNIMAKSRNTLLSAALNDQHEWVLWLDGDVIEYPETILEEMIDLDKDVLVPNCFWHSYNEQGGYDKNNWQETEASWEFQKTLPKDQVLVEGKKEKRNQM